MHQKLRLVLVALAAALVLVGQAAAQSGAKAGGTLNVDLANDVDYTDPALSYLSTGWELEYATCLKLMNYPDANGAKGSQLVPEAAAGFPKVSNSGKTYDFTVNAGSTKFSNGPPSRRVPRIAHTITLPCQFHASIWNISRCASGARSVSALRFSMN